MDSIHNIVFPLIAIIFLAVFIWTIFSKAGNGRMLGGKIIETANNEIVQKEGIATTTLKAHVIEAKNGTRHVGLMLSQNAKLAVSVSPIQLSKKEAETLIEMLNEVIEKT